MSYGIGEHVDDLEKALEACRKIHELYPDATQQQLGVDPLGKPRKVWYSELLQLTDCNSIEVVAADKGHGTSFVLSKMIEGVGPVYPSPSEWGSLSASTILRMLREKRPELYQQLVAAVIELT